jgi:hypothetical protein
MAPKFQLEMSGLPLTLDEICAFEKEIGGRIPEDYKQFLLVQNGGTCEPLLGFPWAGNIDEIAAFYRLLPEDSGVRSSLRELRSLNSEVARVFLPIAHTLSQYEICVAYQGSDCGGAFITEYECNRRGIPIDVRMVRVADSFTEFLDSLVEIPDPYCRIVDLGKRGTADDLAQFLAEGNLIDAVSKYGDTLLCEAIKLNNLPMVRACIERGANLRGTIASAVGNIRIEAIEMLVKAGANVNERDKFGVTPMYYMCGTELPGEEGQRRRQLHSLLISLGAVE